MDALTQATFVLTLILALIPCLGACLIALLESDCALERAYVGALESALYGERKRPDWSVTTAAELRAYRMARPLPSPEQRRFSNRLHAYTGLRTPAEVSAPSALGNDVATRVDAPKPSKLAAMVDTVPELDILTLGLTAFEAEDLADMDTQIDLPAFVAPKRPGTPVSPLRAPQRPLRTAAWLFDGLVEAPRVWIGDCVATLRRAAPQAASATRQYAPSVVRWFDVGDWDAANVNAFAPTHKSAS